MVRASEGRRNHVGDAMRKNGFTLIELLVTIAVAVILATVAVPGFQRMMDVNRVAADHNEILSGLHYARSEAIKRREKVTFDVTATSPWSYQVTVDGMSDPVRVRRGRDGVTSVNDADFDVIFNALGKPAKKDEAGNITSCSSGCSLTLIHPRAGDRLIEVNAMGRVKGGAAS